MNFTKCDSTTCFTELGYTHGKLSQQYQPVPFPLPSPCKDCSDTELLAFWTGFDKGWMDSENAQQEAA